MQKKSQQISTKSIKTKKRKAQAMILEEVLLFSLGLTIIGGMLFTFNYINTELLKHSQQEQAKEINSFIVSNIITLKNMNCTQCHKLIEIPAKVGGEEYTILGEGNKNKILLYNEKNIWNEKDLPIELRGIIKNRNKIILEYENNVVTMRGVDDY